MPKLGIWQDIRIPTEYYTYFIDYGKCLNCLQDLRHEIHAFNHYKKNHLKEEKKKEVIKPKLTIITYNYYVWSFNKYHQIGKEMYTLVKLNKTMCTARVKITQEV